MREIKFRAWDKDNKSIERVDCLYNDDSGVLCAVLLEGYETPHHIDDVELMQYTGLKDKNSKEIYEADIVKAYRSTWSYELYGKHPSGHDGCVSVEFIGIVVFENGRYKIRWVRATKPENYYYEEQAEWCNRNIKYVDFDEAVNVEAIENVWENPELLEKEKAPKG